MIVDNFDLMRSMMNFEDENDFYYVEVMQRAKDGNNLRNCNNVVIKNYFIKSFKYFDIVLPEMKALAEFFNARIYIRLNKRNFKKIAFKMIMDVATDIDTGNYEGVKKSFVSTAGKFHSDKDKTWIIDIDDVTPEAIILDTNNIKELLEKTFPLGVEKFVQIVKTMNGYHLITRPFNLKSFKEDWRKKFGVDFTYDVHKDNPTLMYFKKED